MGTSIQIRASISVTAAATLLLASAALAQEATTARKAILPTARDALAKSALLKLETLPADWKEHPLTPALFFAAQHYEEMQEHLQDFTCVLAKRERINGRLGGYEYLATKVRRERKRDERVAAPFSVYIQYLAPSKIRGRKVLYVDGRNENKIVVRNGGKRFRNVTVKISPDSDAALRESRYPITQLGLTNVVSRLIERAQDDMRSDPTGANTEVTFFRGAKIDDRPCTHIRVVHPREAPGIDFHLANIYVDDKLKVPLRVEGYAWPKTPGDEPRLLEEYTYTRLKLNVGLSDVDFSLDRLAPSPTSR
jgi:hypothetical protein